MEGTTQSSMKHNKRAIGQRQLTALNLVSAKGSHVEHAGQESQMWINHASYHQRLWIKTGMVDMKAHIIIWVTDQA